MGMGRPSSPFFLTVIQGIEMINAISAHVLQVGCEMMVKEIKDEVVEKKAMIGADFNGHVNEGNRGDE